jgi:hypothetical protein
MMSRDPEPQEDPLTPWGRAMCERALRKARGVRCQYGHIIDRHLVAQGHREFWTGRRHQPKQAGEG